jgi:uncharacterized protein YbcI
VGGELNAAIARGTVRLQSQYVGRGPTKARVFYHGKVLVVLVEGTLTRPERNLAANGRADVVGQVRRAYEDAMRAEVVAMIEDLTGCKVEALMSDTIVEPDMGARVFVMDRPLGTTPDRPAVASPDS